MNSIPAPRGDDYFRPALKGSFFGNPVFPAKFLVKLPTAGLKLPGVQSTTTQVMPSHLCGFDMD